MKKSRVQLKLLSLPGIIFMVTGCTNAFNKNLAYQVSATSSASPSPTASTSGDTLTISTVNIAASAQNTQTLVTTINFSSKQSTALISSHCNIATSSGTQTSKPCLCQFKWNEITNGGTVGSSIPHSVNTSVTNVQPGVVLCSAPDLYSTEIVNGTQIKISVVPDNNNPDTGQFTVTPYTYTKNPQNNQTPYTDSEGNFFDNIVRYSCYGTLQRGMSVLNRTEPFPNSNTGITKTILAGTRFCIAKIGGGSSTANCANLPTPDFSAQAYYFNLYTRSLILGRINKNNDGYICPQVTNALNSNGTTGTKLGHWPLDSTFALSVDATTVFNVGVEANSRLSGGETTNVASKCYASNGASSTPDTSTGTNTIISSCLGFAAPVNTDGTCPYFKDSAQKLKPTYRLRRYMAVYPRIFDTDGSPVQQAQAVDTTYVLDRPVRAPATADPLKPYTMLGPKPCPFAYFDHAGITDPNEATTYPPATTTPNYVGTNNPRWDGKNIDGIEFPNFDKKDQSCSTTFPLIMDNGKFTLSTVNIYNGRATSGTSYSPSNYAGSGLRHVYVRPVAPFLPHYEEDTTFQACAPPSFLPQDPPLHFSRDPVSGNVAWCAETYPTQNDSIQSLDPTRAAPAPLQSTVPPTGSVAPYTSHLQKNSASAQCTYTKMTIPSGSTTYLYPSTGYANHPTTQSWENGTGFTSNTCDRNVNIERVDSNTPGLDWAKFPLLAPAGDIEDSTYGIQTNKSYQCLVTYDNNGSKTKTYSPTEGCCSSSSVYVATGKNSSTPATAHLEPDVPCRIPTY
jgi:hypothetical protein